MSTHTLGPWTTIADGGKHSDEGDWYVVGVEEEEVVAIGLTEANARLIAAAPALLNALQDVVDCAQSEGRLFAAVVQNARDAIAKAEGVS